MYFFLPEATSTSTDSSILYFPSLLIVEISLPWHPPPPPPLPLLLFFLTRDDFEGRNDERETFFSNDGAPDKKEAETGWEDNCFAVANELAGQGFQTYRRTRAQTPPAPLGKIMVVGRRRKKKKKKGKDLSRGWNSMNTRPRVAPTTNLLRYMCSPFGYIRLSFVSYFFIPLFGVACLLVKRERFLFFLFSSRLIPRNYEINRRDYVRV